MDARTIAGRGDPASVGSAGAAAVSGQADGALDPLEQAPLRGALGGRAGRARAELPGGVLFRDRGAMRVVVGEQELERAIGRDTVIDDALQGGILGAATLGVGLGGPAVVDLAIIELALLDLLAVVPLSAQTIATAVVSAQS